MKPSRTKFLFWCGFWLSLAAGAKTGLGPRGKLRRESFLYKIPALAGGPVAQLSQPLKKGTAGEVLAVNSDKNWIFVRTRQAQGWLLQDDFDLNARRGPASQTMLMGYGEPLVVPVWGDVEFEKLIQDKQP